ncbi:hypothetical protein B0H10DRAFT_2194100 [Mycena sp. CBHHK59/15]|nr:hypothetical protein B0H10DRAFT_2194100 [Mycena sp. CBHHK59/15]
MSTRPSGGCKTMKEPSTYDGVRHGHSLFVPARLLVYWKKRMFWVINWAWRHSRGNIQNGMRIHEAQRLPLRSRRLTKSKPDAPRCNLTAAAIMANAARSQERAMRERGACARGRVGPIEGDQLRSAAHPPTATGYVHRDGLQVGSRMRSCRWRAGRRRKMVQVQLTHQPTQPDGTTADDGRRQRARPACVSGGPSTRPGSGAAGGVARAVLHYNDKC